MNFIGIDPGVHGAIALVNDQGGLVMVYDMPTIQLVVGKSTKARISPELLAALLRDHQGATAVVEQVSAMPGQGVSSMFSFGESFGVIKGCLAGVGFSFMTTTPAKWKKDMNINASKDGARAMAIQTWPSWAKTFARVKDDGRAEAALLALWLQQRGKL